MIEAAGALRRAATYLDGAVRAAETGFEIPMPKLLFRGRAAEQINGSFATSVTQARRALRELEDVDGPLDDVREGIRRWADTLDPRLDPAIADRRTYTVYRDAMGHLGFERDRLRLIADFDGVAPDIARTTLQTEFDSIIALPNEAITTAQGMRAAMIAGLPAQLRPDMPPLLRGNYPLDMLAMRGMNLSTDRMARGQYDNLRLALQRRDLVTAGVDTLDSLDAEVRAIIAHSNAEVTPAMNERLSMIAGLPDELRPSILDTPMPWPGHKLSQLSAWGWLPDQSDDARSKYDALRMAVEQEQLIADPAVTRKTVTEELVRLMAKPDADLTDADLYRTSLLARLPEHLRPPMPARLDSPHRFEDLGLLGYHPATSPTAAHVMESARVHLTAYADPEAVVRQIKVRIDAGQAIDIRVIGALEGKPELLARAGLTPEALRRQALLSLNHAGGGGTGGNDALLHHLTIARNDLAAASPADPGALELRDQALEIADRNLARMRGERTDTFGRHPDYAEVGRFVSIADLLDALKPNASTAHATSHTASTAAETLTW